MDKPKNGRLNGLPKTKPLRELKKDLGYILGGPSYVLDTKNFNEWQALASNTPIPKRLFNDFFLEGELTILFAPEKTGKTLLAVQIADQISKGIYTYPFTCEVVAPVLYVDCELSAKQQEGRYAIEDKHTGYYSDHFNFADTFHRAELDYPDYYNAELPLVDHLLYSIKDQLECTQAQVVILDNITVLSKNLEKASHALDIMQRLKTLKKERGISILVLAHTPKRNRFDPITSNCLAGSSYLKNFADSVFALNRSTLDKTRYLKQVAVRSVNPQFEGDNVMHLELAKRWNFTGFEFLGFRVEEDLLKKPQEAEQEDLDNTLMELHEEGKTQQEIADQLGLKQYQVSRVLKRLRG